MKFSPLNDKVMIKPFPEAEKTEGGIYKPVSNDINAEGIVVGVGDTVRETIKSLLGKRVLFPKHGGENINIDNQHYFVIKQDNVIGKYD